MRRKFTGAGLGPREGYSMSGSSREGLGASQQLPPGAPSLFLNRGQEQSGHAGAEEPPWPWD